MSMVYSGLLQRVVPNRCLGCAAPSANGFCRGCCSDFAYVARACRRCGIERPAPACPRATARWHVDTVVAPLAYTAPLSAYVQALKFAGARTLGQGLGELLSRHLLALAVAGGVDAVLAVPLYRQRFLERGYNQAFEIARPVAAQLGLPLIVRGIARERDTKPQATLTGARRRANLAGAFRVTRHVAGLRVALVDDVITTGATINALAHALLCAGARTVAAWAVARSL